MRVGLVSDSHDHVPRIREAVSLLNRFAVDVVLHAGDYCSPFAVKELGRLEAPLHGIWGNNDGDVYRLTQAFAEIGARMEWQWWETRIDRRRILMMHEPRGVDAVAMTGDYDLVLYGHTHERDERTVGRTRIVNPGELCGWLGGVPSFAVYDTASGEVEFHEF
ncbi:MAG: metallophosphoesterase [Gemmatimonadota bacterium]